MATPLCDRRRPRVRHAPGHQFTTSAQWVEAYGDLLSSLSVSHYRYCMRQYKAKRRMLKEQPMAIRSTGPPHLRFAIPEDVPVQVPLMCWAPLDAL